MAQYPIAHDPADNASLRQKYMEGKGMPMRMAYVKENMILTGGLWLMQNTEANSARYMSLFNSENIPASNIEALERAGASFYPHWHECEIIRHGVSPTMTTDIAFGKREKTEENIRLAEKDLDENTLDLETGQLVEERKTLQWLKEELQEDGGLESQYRALEAEEVEGRKT